MQQTEEVKNTGSPDAAGIMISAPDKNNGKKSGKWRDKLRFKKTEAEENAGKKDKRPNFIEAGKKTVNSVREKAANTKETISRSLSDEKNIRTYSILAYVPVAGPAIVFLFKRKQEISMVHAVNAAYLQISFLAVWLAIWLLENVPVLSNFLKIIRAVPFVTNALMWANIIMLIGFSLFGIFKANQSAGWRVPYLIGFINEKILRKKPPAPAE